MDILSCKMLTKCKIYTIIISILQMKKLRWEWLSNTFKPVCTNKDTNLNTY